MQGLVSRYVQAPDDVDDVAQEAFIKAYRALPRFRGESAFYTWLYRIAVNTAKNHLVSRNRRPQGVALDSDDADSGEVAEALKDENGPEGALRQDQLRDAVAAAIAALPEDLRSALTLREFDGLSYAESQKSWSVPSARCARGYFGRAKRSTSVFARWWIDTASLERRSEYVPVYAVVARVVVRGSG